MSGSPTACPGRPGQRASRPTRGRRAKRPGRHRDGAGEPTRSALEQLARHFGGGRTTRALAPLVQRLVRLPGRPSRAHDRAPLQAPAPGAIPGLAPEGLRLRPTSPGAVPAAGQSRRQRSAPPRTTGPRTSRSSQAGPVRPGTAPRAGPTGPSTRRNTPIRASTGPNTSPAPDAVADPTGRSGNQAPRQRHQRLPRPTRILRRGPGLPPARVAGRGGRLLELPTEASTRPRTGPRPGQCHEPPQDIPRLGRPSRQRCRHDAARRPPPPSRPRLNGRLDHRPLVVPPGPPSLVDRST